MSDNFVDEPTTEEKEFFMKNFKPDMSRNVIFNPYECQICGDWQTPLAYDMYRHLLSHSRLKDASLKLLQGKSGFIEVINEEDTKVIEGKESLLKSDLQRGRQGGKEC